MTITLDEATRKQVAIFLPELIEKTMQSYRDFISMGPDTETDDADEAAEKPKSKKKTSSKLFAEHHNAGKVALAHLNLLLELAAIAGVKTDLNEVDLASISKGKSEANGNRGSKVPDPLENNDKGQ